MRDIPDVLKRGEHYTSIQRGGEYGVEVYKHAFAKQLYVVDLWWHDEQITTVVPKQSWRKELDNLFFVPLANAIWDGTNIFDSIRRRQVCA